MTVRGRAVAGIVAALAWSGAAWGQATGIETRSAVFYESYSFNAGLPYKSIWQLTVPVGVRVPVGRFDVALSGGFVRTDLTSADLQQLPNERVYGAMDTEVRVGYAIVPGRVLVFAGGAIPTGIKTVDNTELSILGAISSDVIGFAVSNVGSGGSVSGGFAGAIPLGRFALGIGGNFRESFEYQAVKGDPAALRPGSEFRLRGGLEGSLGRRTYLRAAGIWSHRRPDQVGARRQNGVGNRIVGYAALEQGVGGGVLTIYGFDVFRGSPFLEETAVGAAVLPRGNLIAAGLRYQVPVGSGMTFVPRAEGRLATAARSVAESRLRMSGASLRAGFDLRREITRDLAVVVQGGGLTGFVVPELDGVRVGLKGFRAALHAEWRP